ncbi:MAG: ABC transporter ATP-binding protein [candidate division Zixibacteria bacterium SM23_73_2]|nr:MAG: ABC transporter ATP-binding protein [candidate division Zixibacteria bacterium SM23_73_2]
MIKTFNLTKIFSDKKRGEIKAVDGVSLECKPGRIFGLLGLNGAGKTTLMRILSTSLKPTSGTAKIDGYEILNQPEMVKKRIGFLSSDTGLYPRLTAFETVTYFARLNGMEKEAIRRRIDEIFEILDMNDYRDMKVDKLSTGMKQKVSIARTMVHDPQVLILDEPTLGLDVITSRNIIDFVKSSKQRSKIVLFSTHVMHEAEKLCDDIAIIHKGKILEVATLAEYRQKTNLDSLDDIFVKIVGE